MAIKTQNLLTLTFFLSLAFACTRLASADGLLSKARGEVRKTTERHKVHVAEDDSRGKIKRVQKSVRQSHHVEDHHDDHHEREHDRRRNRKRRHRHRPAPCLTFVQPQPVFVEQYYIDAAPRPVVVPGHFVEPVVVAEPVYQPTQISAPAPPMPVYEPATINYCPTDWFEAWNLRATATLGSDFEDVSQFGLGLLIQANGGFGLDGSLRTLRESGADFRDNLWLGDVNLVYEAISSSFFRGRIGGGINFLGDQYGGEAGVNLTAGFDVRLSDRWTLSGEGDIGTLGDADYLHSQLSLGRRFDAATIVFGIDHTDINGVEIESVFTGLQFRF